MTVSHFRLLGATKVRIIPDFLAETIKKMLGTKKMCDSDLTFATLKRLTDNTMQTQPAITPERLEELRDSATRSGAFDALVGVYLRPIYWHARRLVVTHEDAEDIAQETFVRAYEKIGNFRGTETELRAWLYSIATNRALSALRRRRRSLFTSLDQVSRELAGRVSEVAGGDADELLVRLQQAILELPLQQRLVFNLRYYDQMPYAQIARVLGRSEQTLKVNYHYAEQTIRKKITLP